MSADMQKKGGKGASSGGSDLRSQQLLLPQLAAQVHPLQNVALHNQVTKDQDTLIQKT